MNSPRKTFGVKETDSVMILTMQNHNCQKGFIEINEIHPIANINLNNLIQRYDILKTKMGIILHWIKKL